MPFVSSVRGNFGPQRNLGRLKIPFSVTGGSITTSGGYRIHTFSTTGSATLNIAGGIGDILNIEYLVIGGGGSGGSGNGSVGGGGAGGLIIGSKNYTATNVNVAVGSGGPQPAAVNDVDGATGSDSNFDNLISKGGGAGHGWNANAITVSAGGSGGGVGGYPGLPGSGGPATQPTQNPGIPGLTNYGNAGGTGVWPGRGAGGGGAGGTGFPGPSPTPSVGGIGVQSSINGTLTYYGGGGGGGTEVAFPGTYAGGQGGGGTGKGDQTRGGAGTNGLGGGGGGGSWSGPTGGLGGGAGGSGVVVVRYLA